MLARRMKKVALTLGLAAAPLFAQDPQSVPVPETPRQLKMAAPPRSNPTGVTVNPAQPYRPLPAGGAYRRETIFEFYFKALNPRKIHWGDEIDRRIAILINNSVRNPYFRFSAVQMGVILILLVLCWAWWDKLRQVKWIAAEHLTDALNAKRFADTRAMEAITAHNRHMESCNRVIEEQSSGIAGGKSAGQWQQELSELQAKLAAERSKVAQLDAEVSRRTDVQAQMETRLSQLESMTQGRRNDANAELVARLQRAEAELAGRRTPRK